MTAFDDTSPTPTFGTGDTGTDGGDASVTDRAGAAAEQGKHATAEVASDAADRARDVKDEAVRQGRDLLSEARDNLGKHAGGQQENLVANLRSLTGELQAMGGASDEPGVASELVSQAAERLDSVTQWLDGREPQQILQDVRQFARRRPGTFLLGAAAAGLLAGRATRGVAAAHGDTPSGTSGTTGSAPAQHEVPESAQGYSAPPVDERSVGYGTPEEQGPGYSVPGAPVQGGAYR